MKIRLGIVSVLSFVLVFSMLLAGCGSSGSADSSQSSTIAQSTVSAAQDSSKDSVLKDGKMAELVMVYPGGNSSPASLAEIEKAMNNIIKDKIDATIKLKILEWGVYSDQTNLMLSSGENADLMFTFTNTTNFAKRNQVQPITQYVDKYAPDVKKLMEKYLDACRINGELYGLPTFHEYTRKAGLICRKDIFDKLGVDVSTVKTWSDIEQVLAKVHTANPKMNVLTNSETTRGPLQYYPTGIFDLVDTASGVGTYASGNENGKVQILNKYNTKEYMEMAKLAFDWNKKGYFISDATTITDTRQDLIKAGNTFGFIGQIHPGTVTQETKNSGMQMVAIPVTNAVLTTSDVNFAQYMVPSASKNPEKAVAFLNMLYTNKDFQNLFMYGLEGTDYVVKDKDKGVVNYPDGKDSKSVGWSNEPWLSGNASAAYMWETNPLVTWDDYTKFNSSATVSPLYGFVYDTSNVKNEIAAIKNITTKYEAVIEAGYANPDTSVAEFNKELKAAGIDKMVEDAQQQVDKWLASKK